MEIKVRDGAVCLNGLGLPETLSGLDALLQRAYNRLNAVRGAFRYDRTLGSRLPRAALSGRHGRRRRSALRARRLRTARSLRRCAPRFRRDAVAVFLETPLGAGCVTVNRIGGGEKHDV